MKKILTKPLNGRNRTYGVLGVTKKSNRKVETLMEKILTKSLNTRNKTYGALRVIKKSDKKVEPETKSNFWRDVKGEILKSFKRNNRRAFQ